MRFAGTVRVALVIAAALSGVDCGSRDERSVARSASLGDVSQLEPGKGDEPSLLYISPTADFSAYERVVIDPVTVWYASGSSPDRLPEAELRALAEHFESAIRRRLQPSIFEVVDDARAGTLRIRAAFAERGRVWTKLDFARPHGATADTTGNLGAETLEFLRGSLELEVVDAVTGERLAAAIDDRLVAARGEVAGDRLASDTVEWRDVEAFLDSRARRLAARLAALHQLGDPEPAGSAAPPDGAAPASAK
jgi:hypothetical protein